MIASASITISHITDGLSTFCEYAQGPSNATAPASGWSFVAPQAIAGQFLWRREGTALTKDEVTAWHTICLTGPRGESGSTGPKGDKGDIGPPGVPGNKGDDGQPAITALLRVFPETVEVSKRYGYSHFEAVMYASVHNLGDFSLEWECVHNDVETETSNALTLNTIPSESGGGIDPFGKALVISSNGMTGLSPGEISVSLYAKKGAASIPIAFSTITILQALEEKPIYYGPRESPPGPATGEIVLEGDFYLRQGAVHNNVPYVLLDGEWVPVTSDSPNSAAILSACLGDAVMSNTTIHSSSVIYGYFQNLVARNLVVADANDHFIFSVTPDGHVSSSGNRYPAFTISVPDPSDPNERKSLLEVNAEEKKLMIDTDGSFSGVVDSPALTTTKGSDAVDKTYTAEAKSPYRISSLYDGASLVTDGDIETVSSSHYSKPIAKAGKLSDSGETLKLGEWSVEKFKQGSGWTNYANTTVPVGCNFINVILTIYNDFGGTGGSNIEIWRGGTRLVNQTYRGSASSTKSASYTYSVQPGDVLKAYMEGYSLWGSSRGYVDVVFRARASAKSLFFLYEDGSSEFVPYDGHSATPAKIKSYTQAGEYFLASSLRSKLKDDHPSDTWISCLSGSSVTFKAYSNSETTKAIRGFKFISNTVQFLEDDGNVFSLKVWDGGLNSTEGLYASLSTTVITESEPRKVEVATVTPKSGATIGTNDERFMFGYFVSLIAQAIEASGTIKAASIDTGDGAFKIGQDVRTIDDVAFNVVKQNVGHIVSRRWDENAPYIQEIVNAQSGSVIVHSNDSEESTGNNSYTKIKEFTVYITGTINTYFQLKGPGSRGITCYARIYKNGSAVGAERGEWADSFVAYSQDITVSYGDKIQLYAKSYANSASYQGVVRYFRIRTKQGIVA